MNEPVLLYDGLCGLCDGTVQAALRWDRRGTVRFATLQGDFAAEVLGRHPELSGVDSLVLVERGEGGAERVRVRSDAALALAGHLGGPLSLLRAFRLVPRPLRDAVYDGVARIRYRIFGRRDACRIPEAAERERFLD